jgi:hypothetical protein
MPLKTLPTLGDSNWGTPLNNYIQQTTDNVNGGSFNSFTNFVDRPTNLIADDKGKTYLNKRTGNFHIWDGAQWKVQHTSDFVNVLDFGAITAVNDTAVVQAAIDYCLSGSVTRLYLPKGIYKFEAQLGYGLITIYGDSSDQTIMTATSNGGYVFTCSGNGNQNLECLRIMGANALDPNISYSSNGVKCTPASAQGYNGFQPINMSNINFQRCGICLYKEGTLFGKFVDCKFGGEIGVFSKGSTFPYSINGNYSGFDQFNHCKFMANAKCAVYYNNINHKDENQSKFENCWFEGIKGITCLAIDTGHGTYSLKFSHCWFEANCLNYGQNLNIDGVDYVAREFIFKNSKGVIEHAALPNGINLSDNSYLKLDYVVGNEAIHSLDEIEIDASSYLDCRTIGEVPAGGYGGGTSHMADFGMIGYNALNGGLNLYRSKNNRPSISRKYINICPTGSGTRLVSANDFTGGSTQQLIIGDGLYNNKCLKFTTPSSGSMVQIPLDIEYDRPNNFANIQFYAVSFAIRTDDALVSLGTGYQNMGAGGSVILKDKNWHTHCGLVQNAGGIGTGFQFYNRLSTSSSFFVSKLQVVGFATYQQAADYLKSDFYALSAGEPISWHDNAIPITGTYTKGDVIYNTNPTPGGYMGWTCTTTGSPGTWKGFGLIEA